MTGNPFKFFTTCFSKKPSKSIASRSDAATDDDETLSNLSLMMQNSLLTLKKKSLVLDLDETLIHAQTKKDSAHKLQVEFEYYGKIMKYFIAVRPGMIEFLEDMQKYYELYIYTCSDLAYADAILTKIDAKKYFQKIYSRTHCKKSEDKVLSKDLSILGIDFKNLVFIDDSNRHTTDHPLNSLRISDYFGGKTDAELSKIGRFLKKLVFCQDVSSVKEKYRLFLAGKQFVKEDDFLLGESSVSSKKQHEVSMEEKFNDQGLEEYDTEILDDEVSKRSVLRNSYPQIFFQVQATDDKNKTILLTA